MDFAGLGHGYTFREGGNVLQRGGAGYYQANVAFYSKLLYRFGPWLRVEASYNLVEYDLGVHDEKYLNDNNLPVTPPSGSSMKGLPGYLGAYKYYSSPGIALYGFIPISREDDISHKGSTSAYLAAGMLFNKRIGGGEYRTSYNNPAKNEELLLVTDYSRYFTTTYCEAGVVFTTWRGMVYTLGLKYVFGGQMMGADYTNVANGSLISSDKVTAGSSYFAFNLTIGCNLLSRNKREKENPTQAEDNEVIDPAVADTSFEKNINSRAVEITRTLFVGGDTILLQVWDDGTVDGDIISLNLNGNWILKDYTLTTEKRTIEIVLQPGDNKLVLYTESEGRHKPCTAAFYLKDKMQEYFVQLSSDFEKSSCLVLKNGR